MSGDRCADVGKTGTSTDCSRAVASHHQHRHLLECMIGPSPGRIATMIRRYHEHVIGFQASEQPGKAIVECLECCRIAWHIAAMAVDRVEIDKIGKQQSAVRQTLEALQHAIE